LDIIDKHRLLVVASHKFAPTAFTLTVPTGERFENVLPNPDWKTLEDGAEVIRFDLSSAIKKPGKVNVELHTVSMVQLADTGLFCDGVGVHDALMQCTQIVVAIVTDFGKMFFGE
jgi:hypothetical protein